MNTRFFLPLALGGYIVGAAVASADPIEELLVTGSRDKRVVEVNEALVAAPDPAHLLLKAPGANVNNNGPITGILQYRGMYGSRVAVTINGNQIASAGPNAMDAPISYAAGQLESLQIYRGIAPVSVAQESIGGAVEATLARAEYGQGDDFEISGRVRANAQSTNSGYHLGGVLYGSNNQHRFKLGAMTEAGNDASSPDSDIVPTEYDRSRVDLGYGFNLGPHDLQVDYVRNDTGDAGTPALPMDIRWIESDLLSLQYQYELDHDTRMEVRVYGSDLDHGMTNYHLRPEPMKPDMFRRNQARSRNYGFKLTGVLLDDQGQWLVGADGFSEEHDSDIDNPNNPMFFVVNFNRAQRRILGLFAERQQELGNDLSAEFGLRLTRVDMDAGEVNATPAM
ncbi:MAG: TonB-dependent receptor, partial [Halieaceae bacterium]|nr:TonB-dependent receptor [Halieaceae bacterium]